MDDQQMDVCHVKRGLVDGKMHMEMFRKENN